MRLSFRKELMIPMLKFSGWDLFGNMSVMLRDKVLIFYRTCFGDQLLMLPQELQIKLWGQYWAFQTIL